MIIYLARHGQDEDNAAGLLNGRRDTNLTAVGLAQANLLAQTIKELGIEIDQIYCSPLKRAHQTAKVVADTLGLTQPEKLELLIERDFGVMTGKSSQDIEALCSPDTIKSDTINYFLSPVGAETFPQLLVRGQEVLNWLKENSSAKNVLLVTHGDIGKMIYAAFYHLDWSEVLTKFHFGNSELLLLSANSQPAERQVHKTEQYNQ